MKDNSVNVIKTLFAGPSFTAKTYRRMDAKKNVFGGDSVFITRSPEQYEPLDTFDKFLDMDQRQGGVSVFGDMLYSNQKLNDPIFLQGDIKISIFVFLSQHYFDIPKNYRAYQYDIFLERLFKVMESV